MKRIALVIYLLVCLDFGSANAKTLGDFNDDGVINIADVITFIRAIMGKDSIPEIGRDLDTIARTDTLIITDTLTIIYTDTLTFTDTLFIVDTVITTETVYQTDTISVIDTVYIATDVDITEAMAFYLDCTRCIK